MIRRALGSFLLLAGIWGLSSQTAGATSLIFAHADGSGFGSYGILPQGYGNRVVDANQDGFAYGLDGGPTPNIVTVYSQPGMPLVRTWDGVSDLAHCATTAGDSGTYGLFEFDLVADPGYQVNLSSFDWANWGNYNQTIDSLSVQDGSGNNLYYEANVPVPGTGHTHYTFTTAQAPVIKILFDGSTAYDADDVSIDNIIFSQQPVPEPATLLLAGLGFAGLARLGKRRRAST
jgi:hypothetical protein